MATTPAPATHAQSASTPAYADAAAAPTPAPSSPPPTATLAPAGHSACCFHGHPGRLGMGDMGRGRHHAHEHGRHPAHDRHRHDFSGPPRSDHHGHHHGPPPGLRSCFGPFDGGDDMSPRFAMNGHCGGPRGGMGGGRGRGGLSRGGGRGRFRDTGRGDGERHFCRCENAGPPGLMGEMGPVRPSPTRDVPLNCDEACSSSSSESDTARDQEDPAEQGENDAGHHQHCRRRDDPSRGEEAEGRIPLNHHRGHQHGHHHHGDDRRGRDHPGYEHDPRCGGFGRGRPFDDDEFPGFPRERSHHGARGGFFDDRRGHDFLGGRGGFFDDRRGQGGPHGGDFFGGRGGFFDDRRGRGGHRGRDSFGRPCEPRGLRHDSVFGRHCDPSSPRPFPFAVSFDRGIGCGDFDRRR
ncbi:uncharacterized protein PFL1_03903 [Pseudozyma flocculosa PF-1]|uniref:Uncharacterized protein n=2 Tax=Pseudozyma flocculosa TaxID=84751 RepID=A0A5C3EZX1_9BASI|nr:uncharacterized protein PFL1_03903 [Pseudozyma flocculosa PF-1]EPQ28600.1 hypothetical protein PFL1_03903 [Pseudozyma flocculosa PF-1]SPO36541.1 uncharacterized protein PSFLO_02012 [Pseudozyma flocculosa]